MNNVITALATLIMAGGGITLGISSLPKEQGGTPIASFREKIPKSGDIDNESVSNYTGVVINRQVTTDLNSDGNKEHISAKSYEVELENLRHENSKTYSFVTDILIEKDGGRELQASVNGELDSLEEAPLSAKENLLIVKVVTGKLRNYLIYRLEKDFLTRVPVSTERPPSFFGLVTSGSAKIDDSNGDGFGELIDIAKIDWSNHTQTTDTYIYSEGKFTRFSSLIEVVEK